MVIHQRKSIGSMPAARQMDPETYRHHLVQGLLDLAAQRERLSGLMVRGDDVPVSPPGPVPHYGVPTPIGANVTPTLPSKSFAPIKQAPVESPVPLENRGHSSRSVSTTAPNKASGAMLPENGHQTAFLSPLLPPSGLVTAMAPRMTEGDFQLSDSPTFEFRDYEPPLEPPSGNAKEIVRPIPKPSFPDNSPSLAITLDVLDQNAKQESQKLGMDEIQLPQNEIQIGGRKVRVDRRSHSTPEDSIIAAIYHAVEISKKNRIGSGDKRKLPEVSTSILDVGESGFTSARFEIGPCSRLGDCNEVETRVKPNSIAYLHLHPPGGGKDGDNELPSNKGEDNDIASHREIVRGGYKIPAYIVTPRGGVIKYSSEFKKGIEVLPPGTFSWEIN